VEKQQQRLNKFKRGKRSNTPLQMRKLLAALSPSLVEDLAAARDENSLPLDAQLAKPALLMEGFVVGFAAEPLTRL
jgi:hypothetical protein